MSWKKSRAPSYSGKARSHVVLGQESKLGSEHQTSEIFSGIKDTYEVFRNDRKCDAGGVFILIHKDIETTPEEFKNLPGEQCEILWKQIKMPSKKLLNIASIYRPPDSDLNYMENLKLNMCQVYSRFKNAYYILGGDINLTCVDWKKEVVEKNPLYSTNDVTDCNIFVNLMNDIGLTQHITHITRPQSRKTLDLVLSNIPNLFLDSSSNPGMSDHNCVGASFNMSPSLKRKTPRKITCYDKANWEEIKHQCNIFKEKYFARTPNNFSVEENSVLIENFISTTIEKYIPSKMSKNKESYPWITRKVKRAQNKRDRLYQKAVKTRCPEKWSKYKQSEKEAKDQIRSSHRQHLNDFIGDNLVDNPKPFWSYIKNLKKR